MQFNFIEINDTKFQAQKAKLMKYLKIVKSH